MDAVKPARYSVDVTEDDKITPLTGASDIVAKRVKELRKRGGWSTTKAFADRCAEVGAPYLTHPVLMNIESGRRKDGHRTRTITVDELLALALALRVNPADLLLPVDSDAAPYPVTLTETATVGRVREWVNGDDFLVRPRNPVELVEALAPLPKERAARLYEKWHTWDFDQQRREGARIGEQNRRLDPLADNDE